MTRLAAALTTISFCIAAFAQGSDTVASLLHREDVQTELKLTPKQLKQWLEVDRPPRPKRSGTFESDLLVIEDPQLVREREKQREERAWKLLGPGQTLRLMELFVQRAGPLAILRNDVQTRLELRDDQIHDIRLALAAHDMSVKELIKRQQTVKSELGRLDPKKVKDAFQAREEELSSRLDLILDNEQRYKLGDLKGKPFRFLERKFDG